MIDKYLAITILQLFFFCLKNKHLGTITFSREICPPTVKNTTHTHTHTHTHLAQTFQDRKVGGQCSADKTGYFAFTV